MAKKTSKQGKKANKNSEKKATETSKAGESVPQSPIVDKKAGKQAAKSASQSPVVEKKDEKKADTKPVKAQQKAPTRAQSKAAKNARQSSSKQKKTTIPKRILTYFKNVRLEIKRTTWPSRNEVFRMSLIVVGALIFFGVFIFIIDWAMTKLLEIYANFAPTGAPKDVIPEGEDGEEALLVIDYLKMLWRL